MVIKQNRPQVIRYSLTRALSVTFAVALGIEISGILHQNYLKIFTFEYALVFFICFAVSAFLLWITSSRNYQIELDEKGVQIIDEEISKSLNWGDVRNIYRPTPLKQWWLIELNQGKKIKLPISKFSKSQQKVLEKKISNFYH